MAASTRVSMATQQVCRRSIAAPVYASVRPAQQTRAAHSTTSAPGATQTAPNAAPPQSSAPRKAAKFGLCSLLPAALSARTAFAEDAFTVALPQNMPEVSILSVPAEIQQLLMDQPLLVPVGLAVIAVPILLSRLLSPSNLKNVSAVQGLELLKQPDALLLDIRSKLAVKEEGNPDLRTVKKKAVSLPYTKVEGDDVLLEQDFVAKLTKLSAIKTTGLLLLLDSYGQDSPSAAKEITKEFPALQIACIQGGSEGVRGWRASELPWKEPPKGLSFDLSSYNLAGSIDSLAEDFKKQPTLAKAGLAIGAVGAAAVLLFQQMELVLEVLGVVAATQLISKRLLFAKDRKKTLSDIKVLVDEKIKVGEASEDLKKLANTLLETDPAKAVKPALASATAGLQDSDVAESVQSAIESAEDITSKVLESEPVQQVESAVASASDAAKEAPELDANAENQLSSVGDEVQAAADEASTAVQEAVSSATAAEPSFADSEASSVQGWLSGKAQNAQGARERVET